MAPKSSSPRQPAPPLHLHVEVLLQLPRCPRRQGRHRRLQDLAGPGAPPHRAAQANPGLVPPLLDPEWIVSTRSSSRARADLAPRQPRLAVAPASRQPTGALPGLSMEPWSSPDTRGLLSPWSAAAARPYLASITGPHPRHSRPAEYEEGSLPLAKPPPELLPAGSAPESSSASIPGLRARRLRRSIAPPASVSIVPKAFGV